MVTVVAIFVLLVLAVWLYAALAIGWLLANWGAPAAAAFAAFVSVERLGADTSAALIAALVAFVVARIVIVRVIQSLAGLWRASTEPRPLDALAP